MISNLPDDLIKVIIHLCDIRSVINLSKVSIYINSFINLNEIFYDVVLNKKDKCIYRYCSDKCVCRNNKLKSDEYLLLKRPDIIITIDSKICYRIYHIKIESNERMLDYEYICYNMKDCLIYLKQRYDLGIYKYHLNELFYDTLIYNNHILMHNNSQCNY